MRSLMIICLLLVSRAVFAQEAETIGWEDLLPEGELELLEQMMRDSEQGLFFGHSSNPEDGLTPNQIGTYNTVEELNNKLVRLPGYILPTEYDQEGQVTDFLLVPYLGACIHMPPPPPNQIVYVQSATAADYGGMWRPVWVTGIMKAETYINSLGNTAYSMELKGWEPYEN